MPHIRFPLFFRTHSNLLLQHAKPFSTISHHSTAERLVAANKRTAAHLQMPAHSRPSTRVLEQTSSYHSSKAKSTGKPNEQEPWQVQKTALQKKFGEQGWAPRKRLSPDALDGIRALHEQHPENYTTKVLAEKFKISSEAVRRILKSQWRPSEIEQASRRERWNRRGKNIWSQMVELGVKPPKKWRDMGVGKLQRDRVLQARDHRHSVSSENSQKPVIELLEHVTSSKLSQTTDRGLSNRIL